MEFNYDDKEAESRLSTSEDIVDETTISSHVSTIKMITMNRIANMRT